MKPYLVDVPVKINIWIRPEYQRRQFEVIKEARPSVLFIQSDGGRNEEEWRLIKENRQYIDDAIDWDCQVYRLYEEENLGMYGATIKAFNLIWSKVDRCIIMEDDLVPSVSFFQFCADLLEKYKDDDRVECINGMNCEVVTEDCNADYLFSRVGSIWGFATWKRVADGMDVSCFANDEYAKKCLKEVTSYDKSIRKKIQAYSTDEVYEGHVPFVEFWFDFDVAGRNRLQIVPKRNMISNIGCDETSTHSADIKILPRAIRQIFNMQIFEVEFPLKHPSLMVPDLHYEKRRNQIMAYNRPVVEKLRKIESLALSFRYHGIKAVFVRVKRVIKRRQMRRKKVVIEK